MGYWDKEGKISRKAAKTQSEDGFKEDHATRLWQQGHETEDFLQKLTKETKVLTLKDLLRQLSGFPFVAFVSFCLSSISLRRLCVRLLFCCGLLVGIDPWRNSAIVKVESLGARS